MAKFKILGARKKESGGSRFYVHYESSGRLVPGDSFRLFDTHHAIDITVQTVGSESGHEFVDVDFLVPWENFESGSIVDTTSPDWTRAHRSQPSDLGNQLHSSVTRAKAEVTFLPPDQGGRLIPDGILKSRHYRPHIVIGDPNQREALISEKNLVIEDYLGIEFQDGPDHVEPGVSFEATILLAYWPKLSYEKVVAGATFTLREGARIIGYGRIHERTLKGPLTLFLDFDGVLNNDTFLRHQKNHVPTSQHRLFDPVNIESLNKLCARLPIEKIVVTSTWKKNRTINEIRDLLSSEGFSSAEKIHDVTQVLGNQYEARADEIKDWISRNTPSEVLVLDDFDLTNSISEGFYRVNPSDGLTDALVVNIVDLFMGRSKRDFKEAVFCNLHDGILKKVFLSEPNETVMEIECSYLRERLKPDGPHFIIRLSNCRKLIFEPWDSTDYKPTTFDEISKQELEFVEAEEKNGDVVITCTTGELHLNFDSISLWLDDTHSVSQADLEKVAKEYWAEWKANIPKSRK